MHSVFQDHLVEIINNNAPIKTLSVKEKKRRLKLWITPCIHAYLHLYKQKIIIIKTFMKTKAKFWCNIHKYIETNKML